MNEWTKADKLTMANELTTDNGQLTTSVGSLVFLCKRGRRAANVKRVATGDRWRGHLQLFFVVYCPLSIVQSNLSIVHYSAL